jgi:hypothetical protein
MLDSFNFSNADRLVPREDSWAKVVARIKAKKEEQKIIPFRFLSSLSVAASVLFVAGALFLGMQTNTDVTQPSSSIADSEYFSWYSELGSGQAVSTFTTTIDNYFQ